MTDPQEKILESYEEAPHIELNQDGSTINLANWNQPENRHWSYRHTTQIFPYTERIYKGSGAVFELQTKLQDLSAVTVNYRQRDMPLDEYLHESHCNALLVLKDNCLVYENYCRMTPEEHHLCQSVSKTTVCALIGSMIADGTIDPELTVDDYIDDVASGWSGVKLQNLLDMNVALQFTEDFTDPDSDIHTYEMLGGWRPNTGGQDFGYVPYLKAITKDPDMQLDTVTHYLCPNTDMLGLIIARVSGQAFVDLLQEHIYREIGAESDAYFCVDAEGQAICSGGLIIRPRDLIRYGHLFVNRGQSINGKQLIPESWIERCQDTSKGTDYYLGEGFRYHNQMTSDGTALCHLGVGGQMLYANPETNLVVVQLSTTTMPSNGDLDLGNALYDLAKAVDFALQ